MQAYFEQLRTRITGTPIESSNEWLELVQRIETGHEDVSCKLIATELELKVVKEQATELSYAEKEIESIRAKYEEATQQRARFLEVMSTQQNEISRLHEETRSLNQSLESVTLSKNEALGKVCDLESSRFSLDCRVNQLDIEVSQLRRQLDWANEQLEERNNELDTLRRTSTLKVAELERELTSKRSELDMAEQLQQSNAKSLQEQQQQIAEMTAKLHEAQVNFTTMEQRYTAEIQATERRDRLYRDNSEDDRRQLSDITAKLNELDTLVQSKEARIVQILGECDKIKAEALKAQQERDQKISVLHKELENANNLLSAAKKMGIPMGESDIEPLSPAAVVAGRLTKSGLSITQMYTKFLEVSDACQLKDVELAGLKEVLSKVYEELERKGPELKRQREELESARREVLNLREQLDGANKDKLRLQRVIRDRDEKMIAFERDRSSLRLKCGDLTKQVQTLLHQIEIAEGRCPPEDETQVSSSAMETSFQTSGEFISQRLVEFKNIQELQQQNERLLSLIRELSSDKEMEDERQKKVKDLEDDLARLKNDYEDLQTSHRHAQDLLSTVTQQRDSLKLLTQSPAQVQQDRTGSESTMAIAGSASFANATVSTPRPFTISRVTSSSSIVGSPGRGVPNLQKIEEELQAAKKRLGDREAEIAQLQGEICGWKIQLSEQKASASSAESRCQLAERRAESARREADMIRAKSAKQDAICAQLEQTVASMRAELESCRNTIRQRESELGSVRGEIGHLKSSNVQIAAERDALRRAEQHTTMLLASMESIKRAVSEDTREVRRRSLDRVSDMDRELVNLKTKLDEEKHRRAELVKQLELELGTVQKQLAAEQEAHQRTQNALTAATSALAPDSDSAQADLERRQQAEQLASSNTELRLELDEMRRKLNLLEEEKRQKEAKQVELSDFSSTLEVTLGEQKDISENLARSLRDVKMELEQKCAELEVVRTQMEAARLAAETERDQALSKLEALQQQLQAEIGQLKHSVTDLTSERDLLLQEKSSWSGVVSEAESKYDYEVQKHAGSLEQLRQVRQKVTDFEKKVGNLEREKADMTSRLSAADHRVTEMEAQAQAARSEADQYRQQLDALLEKMPIPGGEASMDVTSGGGDAASVELIHFLRRERNVLQSRLDVVESDVSRTRTMLTMAQREAADLRATLNEERKQRQLAQVDMSPSKQASLTQQASHQVQALSAEVQRRLESLDSVLDANKMLRDERDKLDAELKELRQKGGAGGREDSAQVKQRLMELQRQLEVIQAEKTAAQTEAEKWRLRVQNMMEQMKRSEIDELRKAAAERDTLRQNMTERLAKMKVLEQEIASLKQHIEEVKRETETIRTGETTIKAEAEELKSQLAKLNETNQQLRKIATKYKQQYLETDKLLKEKTGGVPIASSLPGPSTTETPAAASNLQETVSSMEVQLASAKAQLDEFQRKLSEAERDKTTAANETSQLRKQLEEVNKKYADVTKLFSSSRTELREAIQRIQALTEECEEAKAAKAELERRYNELQKQYNELHDLYETLERENRELCTKFREALRTGSMTPGSSAAAGQLPVTSAVPILSGNNHGQSGQTTTVATGVMASGSIGASVAEFSPLMDTSGTGAQATVAVSPAAVVHPRLRSQQTATVAPTNVHVPPSRLAPPAPIPPIRVWPTVRQQAATAATSEPLATSSTPGASTTTTEILPPELMASQQQLVDTGIASIISGQQEQPSSPSGVAVEPQPMIDQGGASTSSGRTSVQPQKRSRQQASFGQVTQVSPGEGSSIVGSSSDMTGSVDSADNESNKRRRMLLQGAGQNQQSVMPFSAASSEQIEDDLLLESGAGSSQQMMSTQEPMVGSGDTETEEEEAPQPTGDDLVTGEGEHGGDLMVDVGQEPVVYEEGFDFEAGPSDDHPTQPPAVSSEMNPNEGEEGDESGEGADYGHQSTTSQQQQQKISSESRYEAVDSLDYGDQVVGSSGDNEMAPLEMGAAGGGMVVTGIEAHSAAIDQSEMIEEEDELGASQGGPETGVEEEEEHIEQEEGSSSQGFLGGSGQFGSSSQPLPDSVPWTFGGSSPQQTQSQPTGQMSSSQLPQTNPPQQQQQQQAPAISRPRIEPIIWEASPASSTGPTTSIPGPTTGARRLNVRASAPNMFFQQGPLPSQQHTVHANAPIQTMPDPMPTAGGLPMGGLQQQQVSPQRMPRPGGYPATRARGFGAVPFPPRGGRGGPRRGV